jgi:NADP-dependent 3-hydroxy acid dehydrogenase YdfG
MFTCAGRFKIQATVSANLYKGTKPITGEDIAETVAWILNLPAHVNINTISMMPVCQAFGPLAVHRDS